MHELAAGPAGLVLTAAGTDHIADIQQLVADRIQFRCVLDFEFDSKDALAAGQILAEEFLDADSCGGHGGGNVQQQTISGDAVQLQSGLEGLVVFVGPANPHPAGSLEGMIPVCGIGAVAPVDGHTEALGDETADGITGNGGAALGELDHAGIDILHDDTVDGMAVGFQIGIVGAKPQGTLLVLLFLLLLIQKCP